MGSIGYGGKKLKPGIAPGLLSVQPAVEIHQANLIIYSLFENGDLLDSPFIYYIVRLRLICAFKSIILQQITDFYMCLSIIVVHITNIRPPSSVRNFSMGYYLGCGTATTQSHGHKYKYCQHQIIFCWQQIEMSGFVANELSAFA